MRNALTVDVEDYFHVTAFESHVRQQDWNSYPLRVGDNTLGIIDLFDSSSAKATFFILGWVAERLPWLVKEIHRRGHEVACHGYSHELVYRIGLDNFRQDVRRSKRLLEDICGSEVVGYRAPSYSITRDSLWAFDVLIEEGFHYDSSIFPIIHDIYGIPRANRFPHDIERPSGLIREFPMSTVVLRLFNKSVSVPVAGGGYLRLFPVWFIRKAIDHINTREGEPAVLYFHPWEIDVGQPRIRAGLKSRFRHYVNIKRMSNKVSFLLSSIRFSSMYEVLQEGS